MCRTSRRVYLSPDERYDVWTVKAAERPELLSLDDDSDDTNDGQVLQDGCDIPGWRRGGLVDISAPEGALNVGPGCSLLRRESQLPVVSTRRLSQWLELKEKLLEEPTNTPAVTNYKECMEVHPWFERENVPAVIHGACDHWKAKETFQFQRLVDEYGEMEWRFSDTHAETMTLDAYAKYVYQEGAVDDAPLAVYDSQVGYDERKTLLDHYQVPSCFRSDLLEECLREYEFEDDSHRPPFRWILMGGERSGTGLHVDPAGTHAWVALVQGCKRWVLFPPNVDRKAIGMLEDHQIAASIWYRKWYSNAIQQFPSAVEYLQRPGETVYVPAGWPHIVVNLELSVAITHNYATQFPSIDRLVVALREEEPELSRRFEDGLKAATLPKPATMSVSDCGKEEF